MKGIAPKITESLFRNAILGKFDKEGNYSDALLTFTELLKEKEAISFFRAFMDTCKKYRVDYYAVVNKETPERFKAIVTLNGYDYFEMESDFGNNISEPLANALADTLSIAINNEKIFNSSR